MLPITNFNLKINTRNPKQGTLINQVYKWTAQHSHFYCQYFLQWAALCTRCHAIAKTTARCAQYM